MISEVTAKELKKNNHIGNQPSSEKTINDDWMNTFETEARLKSTDDMQQYFGRVLAGEIRSPNSFSVKTVKIRIGLWSTQRVERAWPYHL